MTKEKNKVQHVLFQPEAVGCDKGLDGAIKDAKHFGVPLAVKTESIKRDVELLPCSDSIKVIVL